jgi:putative tricarboxylic transport membrane protein
MRNPPVRLAREAAGGLVSLVLGAAVIQYARGLPSGPGGYPGPGLFPTIVGVLFVVFGTILFVQAVTGRVAVTEPNEVDREPRWRSIGNVVVLVIAVPIYVALARHLGFVIAMALVAAGVMLRLRVRLRIVLLVAAIVVPMVSYLFGTVLRVPLPAGPLGW